MNPAVVRIAGQPGDKGAMELPKDRARRRRSLALPVAKRLKSLSSLGADDPYTAMSASLR